MDESLEHIKAIAEKRNFSEDLTKVLVNRYNKGQAEHLDKEDDWHGEDFDFRANILAEIADALNYIFEGTRQGELPREPMHSASVFLRWAADEVTNSQRREL